MPSVRESQGKKASMFVRKATAPRVVSFHRGGGGERLTGERAPLAHNANACRLWKLSETGK